MIARTPVTVGPAGMTGLVVPLREPAAVRGTVRIESDPNQPAPSSRVPLVLEPADGSPQSGSRAIMDPTDTSGSFSIDGLAPASYVVRSELPALVIKSVAHGGREYVDGALDLTASPSVDGVVVTVTNLTATLAGTVVNASGRALQDVTVAVFPADRGLWSGFGRSSPRMKSVVTSAAGGYRFINLAAGEYFIAVVPAGRAGDWRDTGVLESMSGTATRVRLEWGATATQGLRTDDR
jgi:hypothetical protein